MKVSDIKKNPGNPRQIKGEKLELLKASVGGFQKMMALRPMIVDENNVVLGGNMRLAAIKALGLKEIPDDWVKQVTDLTPDEKAEFVIKDNNSFGEYDWDAIANEWSDYPLADWGLDVPGFEAVEEVGDADAEPQIDKAAELNKKWGVVSGDLWQIGEHRLLCGDSTNREDVERLMDGDRAQLVCTDPPYNIASENDVIAADVSKAMGDLKAAEWDKDFDIIPALARMMESLGKDATVYVFTSHHLAPIIWMWMNEWSDHHSWCVWNKPNPMPSLMKRHWTWNAELVCYATRGKHTFNFPDDGHALSVWTMTKHSDGSHPTQKPVEVISHAVVHSSKTDDIVLDSFAGSGTTLVACQNLNRKCYAIEISENYCAVILERMATAFPDIEIKRIDG